MLVYYVSKEILTEAGISDYHIFCTVLIRLHLLPDFPTNVQIIDCWKIVFCVLEFSPSNNVIVFFVFLIASIEMNRSHYFWCNLHR